MLPVGLVHSDESQHGHFYVTQLSESDICVEFVLDLRERRRRVSEWRPAGEHFLTTTTVKSNISPVVGHVTLDEVSGSESRHQGELTCQDGGTNHTSQLSGVLTGLAWAAALNTEHLDTNKTVFGPSLILNPVVCYMN